MYAELSVIGQCNHINGGGEKSGTCLTGQDELKHPVPNLMSLDNPIDSPLRQYITHHIDASPSCRQER